MARARNIKPGFFKNEDLAECSPWARLCFVGLWTLADREGRLEDRPKRIKGELFPFDSVEVEPLLEELARFGFIVRYEAGSMKAIQIPEFGKHQAPHYSEKDSVIMPPGFLEFHDHDERNKPGELQEYSGNDGVIKRGSQPSDSLNPDSLIPEVKQPTVAPALQPEERPALALVGSPQENPSSPPDCPHRAVLALWAEVLPEFPQHLPSMWKGARATHLKARWRETAVEKGWTTEQQGLTYLRKFFAWIAKSEFLSGRTQSQPGRKPFIIELEWLVNPSNWAKVQEGKYHEGAA